MIRGWFQGRVVALYEDYLKDSRRLNQPETIVAGGGDSALEAFVKHQDSARARDAARPTPWSAWFRRHSSELAMTFAVLASIATFLFIVGAFRSVRAEVDQYGYGLLLFATIAMVVSGIGCVYFSSLDGSRVWLKTLGIIAIGVLFAATVPPQFGVKRCGTDEPLQRTATACMNPPWTDGT